MRITRPFKVAAVLAASALVFAGCASGSDDEAEVTEQGTVQIEDNNGTHTITVPPRSVVATDNRTFETLADWDVELTAAARTLMPSTNPNKDNEDIIDLGSHNEPDLEAVVAVDPDLIINGQRFTQYADDFAKLTPDAVVLNLDPRDGERLDDELKRQVSVLGEIFGKQDEAAALGEALDAEIARAAAAYDSGDTVMAVNVSGGNIGYLAPGVGRTLGPVFEILNLTPALEVEGSSDDHQGDDISVEAIAQSNPTWILVMDRDAAVASGADSEPAETVIENSQALANVTAVKEGNIVYLPADTYTNEGIQTYTEFFALFADALEAKN